MIVNLVSKSLVVLFLVMVVMSILFGASISDAEFLSPSTTAAKARQINIQTDMQEKLNSLELQKLEAQTQEEVTRINLEIEKEKISARLEMEHIARLNELEAAFISNLHFLILILMGTAGLVLTFTLSYLLLRSGLARISASAPVSAIGDPWADAAFRSRKRMEAREREKAQWVPYGKNGYQKIYSNIPQPQNGVHKDYLAEPITKRR